MIKTGDVVNGVGAVTQPAQLTCGAVAALHCVQLNNRNTHSTALDKCHIGDFF